MSKLIEQREGATLQGCLAGTLQDIEDLSLGCFPNALDESQEASGSRGFGQICGFQLLLLSLPLVKQLRQRCRELKLDKNTEDLTSERILFRRRCFIRPKLEYS